MYIIRGMKEGQKELLLSSTIAKSLGDLDSKFAFWGIDLPKGETLWEGNDPLTIERVIAMINPNDEKLRNSSRLKLLYCIGWELIWGQASPGWIEEERAELLMKINCGLDLDDLEKLWYNLMQVDTDMF